MAYSSSTVISSSLRKEVYSPEAFVPHAALLRQAFAHCGKFPTAASRRSLGRVSVPVWLIILSDQLLIEALVSHYLTNYLIGRELLLRRPKAFIPPPRRRDRMRDYPQFPEAIPHRRVCYSRVTQPSAASPDSRSSRDTLDLHALSAPPAFTLSHDQTL